MDLRSTPYRYVYVIEQIEYSMESILESPVRALDTELSIFLSTRYHGCHGTLFSLLHFFVLLLENDCDI